MDTSDLHRNRRSICLDKHGNMLNAWYNGPVLNFQGLETCINLTISMLRFQHRKQAWSARDGFHLALPGALKFTRQKVPCQWVVCCKTCAFPKGSFLSLTFCNESDEVNSPTQAALSWNVEILGCGPQLCCQIVLLVSKFCGENGWRWWEFRVAIQIGKPPLFSHKSWQELGFVGGGNLELREWRVFSESTGFYG